MVGKEKELELAKDLGNTVAQTPEEVLRAQNLLFQKGYSLARMADFLGVPVMYQYTKGVDPSSVLSFLDNLGKEVLDEVHYYLSCSGSSSSGGVEGYESFGSYRATLYLSRDGLGGVSYSYSFSFVSYVGPDYLPSWFFVDVSGSMNGPHPEGAPQDFSLGSRIYVPVSYKIRLADGTAVIPKKGRTRRVEEVISMLLGLLDSFKDKQDFLLSTDVYLTSGNPVPRKGEGEGDGGKSPSYIYIGTVGDLLSGLLGDQVEEEEEEEEEEEYLEEEED